MALKPEDDNNRPVIQPISDYDEAPISSQELALLTISGFLCDPVAVREVADALGIDRPAILAARYKRGGPVPAPTAPLPGPVVRVVGTDPPGTQERSGRRAVKRRLH